MHILLFCKEKMKNINVIIMNSIIVFIYFMVLPIFSFKEIKPKLCINCKYFITDYNKDIFGKCSLFPIKEEAINHLINGIQKEEEKEYYYCSTSRRSDNMCGIEGKMYKKKYVKKINL